MRLPKAASVTRLSFTPDSRRILVGASGGAVLVVDSMTAKFVAELSPRDDGGDRAAARPSACSVIATSADGQWAATGTSANRVEM